MGLADEARAWRTQLDDSQTLKVLQNDVSYEIIEIVGNITFKGNTTVSSAISAPDTSAAIWRVERSAPTGNQVIRQCANNGLFDQVWDNRLTLFPDLPFTNQHSVQFGGVNERIDFPHDSAFSFDFRTEAASWNIWTKISAAAPTSFTVLEKQGGTNAGWRLHLNNNRFTIELRGTGTASDRIRVRLPSTPIDLGIWSLWSFTYDGSGLASGISIYKNGVAFAGLDTQNDGLVTDTNNLVVMSVGARTGGGNVFGPGNIDEISIHNVELNSAEILQMYNNGFPINLQDQGLSPITANLKFFSRMGDGPDDIFPNNVDIEGGIIGTMENMTAGDYETEVPNG